ncbi:DUF4242 domain-containing protein [Pseudoalteromonas sp. SSDWG2]|uniref:DUF4242 domain-containing protein n=1 Tax=Pseudoalteromonas sp. SSDWG2 TaxID=3139391 RepID=UPI003BAA5085
MPKYVIEREVEGAGQLSGADLQGISVKSCDVLQQLGPTIQWVESYVTGNKIFCVYIAPDESLIEQHARMGEFPITAIHEVKNVIDPTTAE